jgi:hypothetical protein
MDFAVRLRTGQKISGRVVDESGRGVAGALVETVFAKPASVVYPDLWTGYRKAVLSDQNGIFELRGLVSTIEHLQVLKRGGAGEQMLVGSSDTGMASTTQPVSVVVRPLVRPGMKVHELLGMKLVDVDAQMSQELAEVLPGGIVVIDPGTKLAFFPRGKLEQGDRFWMVGQQRVNNFDEFARALATECETKNEWGMMGPHVRVVFDHADVTGAWSSTEMMKLNAADLAEIEKAAHNIGK